MPGVQKPHWSAPLAANAEAYRSRSTGSRPSTVVIDVPSTLSIEIWHATRALPSISTVQQPHWPLGEQPSFGDVTPSSSRSALSRWGWSSPALAGEPLRTNSAMGNILLVGSCSRVARRLPSGERVDHRVHVAEGVEDRARAAVAHVGGHRVLCFSGCARRGEHLDDLVGNQLGGPLDLLVGGGPREHLAHFVEQLLWHARR